MEHIHKFKRVVIGSQTIKRVKENGRWVKRLIKNGDGHPVYRCILPGCKTHFARELMEGRKAICWRCGEEMTITAESLTLVKPRHFNCRKEFHRPDVTLVTLSERIKS